MKEMDSAPSFSGKVRWRKGEDCAVGRRLSLADVGGRRSLFVVVVAPWCPCEPRLLRVESGVRRRGRRCSAQWLSWFGVGWAAWGEGTGKLGGRWAEPGWAEYGVWAVEQR